MSKWQITRNHTNKFNYVTHLAGDMAHEHLDEKLINSLLGNGRASLRSLAEELDVSVTMITGALTMM